MPDPSSSRRPAVPTPVDGTLVLEKGDVSLSFWSPIDLDTFYEAFSESRDILSKKFWWAHDMDHTKALRWLASQADLRTKGFEYAFKIAFTTPDGSTKVAGHISIGWVDWLHRRAVLGFWLRPSCQGLHLAVPVIELATVFAFEHLALNRVELTTAVSNTSARKCFEAAGATYEGTARNRFIVDGEVTDGAVFSLIPS